MRSWRDVMLHDHGVEWGMGGTFYGHLFRGRSDGCMDKHGVVYMVYSFFH